MYVYDLPMQWVPGALSLEVKRPGSEADHSPLPSDEVKECVELYLHSTNKYSWRGALFQIRTTLNFRYKLTVRHCGRVCNFAIQNMFDVKTCMYVYDLRTNINFTCLQGNAFTTKGRTKYRLRACTVWVFYAKQKYNLDLSYTFC
jgi:hypothetical protein